MIIPLTVVELSGLSLDGSDDQLWAVSDKNGRIYVMSDFKEAMYVYELKGE